MRTTLTMVLLTGACLLGLSGCKGSSGHGHVHVQVEPAPIAFHYGADPFYETYVDAFLWDNPYPAAVVEVVAVDLDGDVRIVIEDAFGVVVYDALYTGFGGGYLNTQDFTFDGVPGTWYVEITGKDVAVDLSVSIIPVR